MTCNATIKSLVDTDIAHRKRRVKITLMFLNDIIELLFLVFSMDWIQYIVLAFLVFENIKILFWFPTLLVKYHILHVTHFGRYLYTVHFQIEQRCHH